MPRFLLILTASSIAENYRLPAQNEGMSLLQSPAPNSGESRSGVSVFRYPGGGTPPPMRVLKGNGFPYNINRINKEKVKSSYSSVNKTIRFCLFSCQKHPFCPEKCQF